MNNLDEDIKIIKEFISFVQDEYVEAEVNGKFYKMSVIPLDIKPTKDLAKAISNVLSELETYKKIAEKLAGYGFNCYYGSPLKFDSPKELIEVARKEVEKDDR